MTAHVKQHLLSEVMLATGEAAQIFSLDSLMWREGEPLPNDALYEGIGSVQLTDGFLAIGGYQRDGASSDKIYKFDQNSYEWTLLEERLETARHRFTSTGIPNDFLTCQ